MLEQTMVYSKESAGDGDGLEITIGGKSIRTGVDYSELDEGEIEARRDELQSLKNHAESFQVGKQIFLSSLRLILPAIVLALVPSSLSALGWIVPLRQSGLMGKFVFNLLLFGTACAAIGGLALIMYRSLLQYRVMSTLTNELETAEEVLSGMQRGAGQ